MCFGCSKESSHRDDSFAHPQHMFWLRNKKIILSYALLSGGLVRHDMNNGFFFLLTIVFIYLFENKLSEVPEYSKMQFHMMTLLDVLGTIAWVRYEFLAHQIGIPLFLHVPM